MLIEILEKKRENLTLNVMIIRGDIYRVLDNLDMCDIGSEYQIHNY